MVIHVNTTATGHLANCSQQALMKSYHTTRITENVQKVMEIIKLTIIKYIVEND